MGHLAFENYWPMSSFWVGIQADLHCEYRGSIVLRTKLFLDLLKNNIPPKQEWILHQHKNTYSWRMPIPPDHFHLLESEELNKRLQHMAEILEKDCKESEIQASNVRVCNFLGVMQEKIEIIDSMNKRLTRVEENLDRLLAHFDLPLEKK
jgi:hypothetical protein